MLFFTAFVVLMLGFVAYVWWWNAHGAGKDERLRLEEESRRRGPRLQLHGWRYDGRFEGDIRYRVRGVTTGGLEWLLEYDSDHSSSSSSPKLRFRVESLKVDSHAWELLDRWSFDFARKGMTGKLISGIAALGGAFSQDTARKRSFFLAAAERPVGTPRLRERFVLIAESADYDTIIDDESEARILDWPPFTSSMSRPDNGLSAGLRPSGFELHLYVRDPDVAVIEHLIRLGQHLADASANALNRRTVDS